MNEVKAYFKAKFNSEDRNTFNVINQIKSSIIEQGMINGLATGSWGSSSKSGVSQALQRHSYIQTVSYFRRVVTPRFLYEVIIPQDILNIISEIKFAVYSIDISKLLAELITSPIVLGDLATSINAEQVSFT